MIVTNPTTARGIFYKLAQEFKEMDDRRKKIPIHQTENVRIRTYAGDVILSEERAKNLQFGPILRLKEESLRYRSE